jgi:flagellar motor switch protein FliN/FliY
VAKKVEIKNKVIIEETQNNGENQEDTSNDVKKVGFPAFKGLKKEKADNPLDMLLNIPMKVIVELGIKPMKIKDILELGPGSIIELDKLSGEPVDILVNDRMIAKGEVVVIDENFGIRITDVTVEKKDEMLADANS